MNSVLRQLPALLLCVLLLGASGPNGLLFLGLAYGLEGNVDAAFCSCPPGCHHHHHGGMPLHAGQERSASAMSAHQGADDAGPLCSSTRICSMRSRDLAAHHGSPDLAVLARDLRASRHADRELLHVLGEPSPASQLVPPDPRPPRA